MATSPSLLTAARVFREAMTAFDPRCASLDDAQQLAAELALTEKLCAALRAKTAARVAEVEGERAFSRLARQAGTTAGRVRREIETVNAASENPELSGALDRGELSLDEAGEIAKTEAEAPGATRDLLDTARRRGLGGLRDEGRRRRQAAMDEKMLQERRRRARGVWFRHDELGMSEITVKLLPEHGERLRRRLEAQAQRRWREGDRSSTPANRLADAVLDVVVHGSGAAGGGRTEMVVVAHLDALTRGFALAEEPSHVVGGPKLPVDTVKALARDALLTVVLHDGEKVDSFLRFGRHIPAALRVLLDIGDPPMFLDAACAECGHRYRLQLDHVDPVANGGPTSYANLQRLCPPCHAGKTGADREAGLLGNRPRGTIGHCHTADRRAAAGAAAGAARRRDPP